MSCIFCRIASGEVPSSRIHEDELCFAVRDIRPQAPVHLLVIPKQHLASLHELEDEVLAGRLLAVAAKLARAEKLEQGWRLIANAREHAGQEVAHLHLHVLGGRKLGRMLPG
jgi:histidine triad (HIT) family protein